MEERGVEGSSTNRTGSMVHAACAVFTVAAGDAARVNPFVAVDGEGEAGLASGPNVLGKGRFVSLNGVWRGKRAPFHAHVDGLEIRVMGDQQSS